MLSKRVQNLIGIGFASLILVVSFVNCTTSTSSSAAVADSAKFFQTTPKVVIHSYYEAGADPFTGTVSGGNLWDVLEENLVAIFQYRSTPPTLTVPKTLAEMTSFPSQSRSSWTSTDLRNLDSQYGSQNNPDEESHFNVYFVRGYFNDGSGANSGIIGVSLGGTNIVVIFKDVVESTGGGAVQKYVEQSTIVHELGHALGFVNNGVPMATPHQDTEHGAHTTDTDCVMYWANEGKTDLSAFVVRFITSGSKVMWGPNILADAEALSR